MKVTAALLLAVAGYVAADSTQTAQAISEQAKKINSAIEAFGAAVKGYSGGDASKLTAASNAIGEATKGAQSALSSASPLTLTDALGIQPLFQSLQGTIDSTMQDLTGIKSKLVAANQGCEVVKQLTAQEGNAQALATLIVGKVPTDARAIAETLAGKVGGAITSTKSAFADACTSGGSSGSSSSESSSSGSSSSGGHSASGGHSGSSSSSSGSGSGAGSAGAAKQSSVPKPAVYTGAGSINAPALGAAALAIAALAF